MVRMWVGRLPGKLQRRGRGEKEGLDREGFLPFTTGVSESGPYRLVGVSSGPELERGKMAADVLCSFWKSYCF